MKDRTENLVENTCLAVFVTAAVEWLTQSKPLGLAYVVTFVVLTSMDVVGSYKIERRKG